MAEEVLNQDQLEQQVPQQEEPPKKLSVGEFASKIKSKYPEYKDIDDNELTSKMLSKFPIYKDQVDFIEKKNDGQPSKPGGQEPKTSGTPPTLSPSPSSLQEGQKNTSWQTSALNPAYSAQQAQIKKEAEPKPKQKDWKDIVFDKSSFNKPVASDATYVAKNVTGEKIEQVTKSRANMQIAIDNTTERALKAKGLAVPKNSPAYIKQRKKVEEAVKNNDAVYTVDPTTKQPALSQTTGFFESIKNSFISAVNDEDESDEFVNNMDTQQRVDYANKKREEAYALTKEGYVGKTPSAFYGEAGQIIGGAIPFVTKMTAGTIAGAGLIAAAPETGGASLAGIPAVLQFAFTVKDAVNQGGKNEVMRRFDILKQQKPDASDFDLMKEAESGLTSGEITGGLTNLVFTAIGAKPAQAIPVIEKSLANTLKNTAHGTIKAGVELGTISAGGTAVQEIEAGLEDKRFKKSAGEIIDDTVKSFGSGLTTGILLHTATQAVLGSVNLPGQLRSAVKYSLSKENPVELQAILSNNEQLGNIPQGTTEAVMADLNSYNKSLEKTSQDLTPETQASVAGLIQKRDNLMSEMSSKDATQIDPYLQQIDAINEQIKKITETNDPFAYEVNDVTGQPLNGEISEAPIQKGVEGKQEIALNLKEGDKVYRVEYYDTDAKKMSSKLFLDEDAGKKFEESLNDTQRSFRTKSYYDKYDGKEQIVPKQKTQVNDTENITGLPSKVGVGEEPIPAEPIKGAGAEKVSTGGNVQAPRVEGEWQGVGEKVGEEVVSKLKDIESTAKELEGKDISKLIKDLGIESNWDMVGEGDLFDNKSPEYRYTQRLLPEWNRVNLKGEINPNSKLTYDIVKGRFGGIDNKEVVEAKDENGRVVGVIKLSSSGGIEHIAVAPEFRGKGVADKLLEKLKENNPNLDLSKTKLKSKGFEKAFAKNIISEAYYKAKADGSNPELVKAVEDLIGKKTEVEPPKQERAVEGIEGEVVSTEADGFDYVRNKYKERESGGKDLSEKEATILNKNLNSLIDRAEKENKVERNNLKQATWKTNDGYVISEFYENGKGGTRIITPKGEEINIFDKKYKGESGQKISYFSKAHEAKAELPKQKGEGVGEVDVKSFKQGEGGTRGVFEDKNGNLYKSLEPQEIVMTEKGATRQPIEGKITDEHKILSELQGNPHIPKVGEIVNTTEGKAFEIERLDEVDSFTKDEYREIQKILNDLNDKGYHVGDKVTVMRRPKTGELVIVDFSNGYKGKRMSRDAEEYMQGVSSKLNKSDAISIKQEDMAESNRYMAKSLMSDESTTEYYLTQRPPSIGTHPTDGLKSIEETEYRGKKAWKLLYDKKLSPNEIYRFELTPKVTNKEYLGQKINGVYGDREFYVLDIDYKQGKVKLVSELNGKEISKDLSFKEFQKNIDDGNYKIINKPEAPQQKGEGVGGIEKKPFSIDNKEDFYHGSYNKREGKLRTNTAEQFGDAIYFTTSKEEAEGGYPYVTKVKLNIENPIYAGEGKWNEVERLALEKENANKERDEDGNIINEVTDIADIRNSNNISDAAKELGYDAIILRGEGNHQNETAVLDPSKIIYPEDILETPKKEEAKIKGIDEKEIARLAKPITDRMVEIEREFENQGYTIDTTFDNEIQILDKNGEQVEFDDLPNELKDITLEYQSATAKLGDISDVARENALAESRKVVETEAEVIEPEKVALPEQSQEQVNQQELKETENLLNDGDKIRKEGKYVKDGVEYVRNEKGLGIKSEEGGSVRFTSEPGGGGVSVPFTYKLIESETLQPSHQDGLRNPNHFIWEAQPKNRNDEGSIQAEEGFANKPRFTEMGENTNAYSGAPIVNERGEVIQGNNRSAGLKKGYQRGIETYKKSLAENAEKFGFTKEQVEGMKNPVLVREVAVSDSGAIELGNYDVKDLESGGKRRLDPVAITRRMPFELKGRISDLLFKGEGTLNQAIRDNTKRLMELINPFLNQAQRNTIFKDGELTQDGAKDLETVAQHFLFDGGDTALPELHDNLSHTQKEGLRKSLPHIFSTGIEKSIVPEVQEAIIALNDFAASKAGSFDNWLAQSDMFNNGMTPKDKYSPTAIKIAEILNDAKNQKEITTQFGKYAELVNDKPATMFDEATKGISKKEGIKQIFKTEYDESKRPAISEGGGKEIPTQEEPLPQPSTEPSAAKPAKPTTKAAAETAKPKPTEAKPELPEQSALDKAREARKAAKEKLNAIRKGLGITPDPKKEAEALFEYHKALVTEAKEYIKAGIETVEEWAKEVGEKVNVALKSAWDEATGKVPPTEKAEDITYTSSDIEPRVSGVKKAITTPLRESLGLPAVELPKMGTDIEELQQAKQRIDSGDVDPISMIDDILKNDRGYKNEKEVFDMQYYAHQLDAKDRELSREMSEADNDIDKAEIANRKQLLSDEIDKQTEAARKAGNKWGKIGYSMQPVIDTEFSMSRERNLIKEAYAGEVPQQVKEKIEIITKERDDAIAQKIKIEKDLADLKAKKEIEKKQKEVDAEQKGKSKKTREDFIKERQSIVDKIKKKWRDAKGGGTMYSSAIPIPIEKVKQLAAISPEVGELIKSHVEEGVSKLSDIVDNIHDLLKDQIDGLTKKDVLDLIGGKYSISKERSEAAKKVAEIRAEAKKLLKENPTPSEKMQSEIDRLNKKADNIEAKLREGVVIKEKESELNPYNNSEWIKADQRVVNAEKKMRDLKRDAFESQKNWYQKSLMWAGRAVRLAVLSGYKVLGKLASAATIGGAVKRIPEQAIGAIYNKVFSSIAKKAPIEGSSMALNSELKWYKEFFNPKKFVRNSWDILKTGTTYLNKKMGKSEYEHIPILYAATDLHQIIKDPVKRATFEASFDNAMRYAAKEGLDVTDPLVIQSIENAAFKRANYEIFQESNALTRKFTAWKNEMEQKGNLGATAKFVADFFIPISSVPTNIARRVGITSPFGLLKANVDVINAYRKGMENLKPEEADMIMRQLKQGTLGTALWMIGWFGYASFGGLYTKFNPNKQRDDEDLASDKMEVGGVEIPKPTQHALPLEVIQSAATARRLWNKYNEDEEASKFGNIAKAGLASIGAVAEQVPIIETPVHMIMATQDPYEAKKLGEDIKGRVQPQILKETGIISKEDKEKRIFTEKEMESDKYKNLINAKLNIPKIGRRLSYDIKPDEAHPKGKMTVDEFNKFSDLVAKYSHDNTDYITTKYAIQISKLKDLVSKESKDPKVLSEITVLSKAIESKLELAHKKAIEKARAELKFPTH